MESQSTLEQVRRDNVHDQQIGTAISEEDAAKIGFETSERLQEIVLGMGNATSPADIKIDVEPDFFGPVDAKGTPIILDKYASDDSRELRRLPATAPGMNDEN
jgi:hypothetical protein